MTWKTLKNILFTALCLSITASPIFVAQANTTSTNSVEYLQRFLDILGYDPGPIDGAMGTKTRNAYDSVKTKIPWLLDSIDDIEDVVADLYVLTIPVEYDNPAKPVGQKCSGAMTVSNGIAVVNMGDCPGSHLFLVRQFLGRAIRTSTIRSILYGGMKGDIKGNFKQTYKLKVKPEDELKTLRGRRLSKS